MKSDSALFYSCSLIEYIGRQKKQKCSAVVQFLGKRRFSEYTIMRIFSIVNQSKRRPMISSLLIVFLKEILITLQSACTMFQRVGILARR